MRLFILYLSVCFFSAYFIRDQNPKWRYLILSILSLILCVGYGILRQL